MKHIAALIVGAFISVLFVSVMALATTYPRVFIVSLGVITAYGIGRIAVAWWKAAQE